jgi:hypothetical protein
MDAAKPLLSRIIAPWPLFLGVTSSFLGCIVAGHRLAELNCYGSLSRFHPQINYLSLHYPTVAHIRALGRDRLDPGKIVVVVGGNSVLYGAARLPDSFATRLQALLGDDYQVLNLAMCGALSAEFGATAAEVLSQDFPRLIFVSNDWPGPKWGIGEPDGRPYVRYLFWEAHARRWLTNDPVREARLHELARARRDEAAYSELRLQIRLDHTLSFRDLWTTLECTHLSTTWSRPVARTWWKSRQSYLEQDVPSEPLPVSALESLSDAEVKRLRTLLAINNDLTGGVPRFPAGALESSIKECFPEACRRRTVMLVNDPNPYFLAKLTAAERGEYYDMAAQTVAILQSTEMTSMEIGRDYPAKWFLDTVHLTGKGNARMAEQVGPIIRRIAGRLGYAKTDSK